MLRKTRANRDNQDLRQRALVPWKIPLAWMLTLPFIVQVAAVVGVVGYLSARNGQRSVENLTNQLMAAVSNRIDQKITHYLESAVVANQINGDAVQRGALDLDFDRPNAQTEQFLWQQMQLFPNLTWISLGTEQGNTMGVWRPEPGQPVQLSLANRANQHFGTYYAMNGQGMRRPPRLKVEKPAYDPRSRPWYKEAIADKRAIWTKIYAGFTPGTIFIAASQPLYDRTGQLVGVSGIDISLKAIQQFLAQTPVSASGQVFLMERSGLLVASSSQEQPFRLRQGRDPVRVDARDSQTPLIQKTTRFLDHQFPDFQTIQQRQQLRFTLDHQDQFVQILPLSIPNGLDWLMVLVVPESDVMAQIHAGTRTTLWLCLGAVAGVIALNTAFSRWFAKPIIELSQASHKIAQGDFSAQVQGPSVRELSTLADSFTQMSQEIQQSRHQLEAYSRSLEQKVSDRTQALQTEVERRAGVEQALQAANQKLLRLAYLDGLTQIPNRRCFDERFSQEWYRMKREGLPLSLILCDVDYFKQYNDTYGHQVGDDCLCQIAKVLLTAARRPSDLSARYGGEEFVVLLPNTDQDGALKVAALIQSQIQDLQLPHAQSGIGPYVTASFGVVSLIPVEEYTSEEFLAQADRALYQAKRAGRDRIAVRTLER